MINKRILYISSELFPYTPESPISIVTSKIPKIMQGLGNDVRIFMPRYGFINERKYQLHEVIRLSGMNLTIKDIDQPLIIKVASMPESRLQVYFIDNEEYFKRRNLYKDNNKIFFKDNDDRMLFFTKGVIETIKKLNWSPDIIHIHGWMGSFIPLYLKTSYKEDFLFQKSIIITSIYNQNFEGYLNKELIKKIIFDRIDKKIFKNINFFSFINLIKISIDFSNIVIKGEINILKEIEKYFQEKTSKILNYYSIEDLSKSYNKFYKNQY